MKQVELFAVYLCFSIDGIPYLFFLILFSNSQIIKWYMLELFCICKSMLWNRINGITSVTQTRGEVFSKLGKERISLNLHSSQTEYICIIYLKLSVNGWKK